MLQIQTILHRSFRGALHDLSYIPTVVIGRFLTGSYQYLLQTVCEILDAIIQRSLIYFIGQLTVFPLHWYSLQTAIGDGQYRCDAFGRFIPIED